MITISYVRHYDNRHKTSANIANIHLKGVFFPCEKEPIKNTIICFFTKSTCISCIFNIIDEQEILLRETPFDIVYYTNVPKDEIPNVLKLRTSITSIKADSTFKTLGYPLIAKTNENGRIESYIITNPSTPDLTQNYLHKIN